MIDKLNRFMADEKNVEAVAIFGGMVVFFGTIFLPFYVDMTLTVLWIIGCIYWHDKVKDDEPKN